jgi:hypothetical protein
MRQFCATFCHVFVISALNADFGRHFVPSFVAADLPYKS